MSYGKKDKRWYLCPNCKKKLIQYHNKDAYSKGIFLLCKNCKTEVEIKLNTKTKSLN